MHRPDTALDVARTHERAVITFTVVLTVALVALVAPTYRMTGDPDYYVGLARALAEGHGLTFNGSPGVKYPPGFPLLLAPAAAISGGSFAAIARWSAAIAALGFPLSFWMLRRRQEAFALPLAVASVVTVVYIRLATGNPMSEPVYLAWTMGLLVWADGWELERNARSWPSILAGCLLVVGAISIRIVGLSAVAAAGMLLASRLMRRTAYWRDALPFAAGLTFAVAWFLWSGAHRGEVYVAGPDAAYTDLLFLADPANPDAGLIGIGGLGARAWHNLIANAAYAGALLTQLPWLKAEWYSPAMVLVPLLAAGMWRHSRRGAGFAVWYVAAYCGILALWPFDERGRFLVPLTPLLMLFAVEGLRAASEIIRRYPSRVRMTGLVWAIGSLAGAASGRSRQDIFAASIWLAVIVSFALTYPGVLATVDLLRRKPHPLERGFLVALFAAAGFVQAAPDVVAGLHGQLPPGSTEEALGQASQWLNANTNPAAIILTTWPGRTHLSTGRLSIALPATADREILRRHAEHNRSDYLVVLADPAFPYVRPSDKVRWKILDELFPGHWLLATELPRARIYQIAR